MLFYIYKFNAYVLQHNVVIQNGKCRIFFQIRFSEFGGMSMDATSVVSTDVGYYLLLCLLFTTKLAKLHVLNIILL